MMTPGPFSRSAQGTTAPSAPKIPKAIALMSGGLDSTLAAKLVKDQGVDVVGLHLVSPFGCREDVQKSADIAGVPLLFREKGEAYLDLVKNPRYGYGRAMNPCIDCRIFMFTIAEVVMRDEGADFIVTGEVLGQRPMSQQRGSMELIDRKSPIEGLVLRPLSAHCFEPTEPEKKGWVDREKLLSISGRSRKEQFALAEQLGIKDYSTPSGGCLLTETGFAGRLKDFFESETHASTDERLARAELLRLGRHFRPAAGTKVILGRNEKENGEMEALWKRAGGHYFMPANFDGPSAIVLGAAGEEEKQIAGALIARYGKGKDLTEKKISFWKADGNEAADFVVERSVSDEQLGTWRL